MRNGWQNSTSSLRYEFLIRKNSGSDFICMKASKRALSGERQLRKTYERASHPRIRLREHTFAQAREVKWFSRIIFLLFTVSWYLRCTEANILRRSEFNWNFHFRSKEVTTGHCFITVRSPLGELQIDRVTNITKVFTFYTHAGYAWTQSLWSQITIDLTCSVSASNHSQFRFTNVASFLHWR